MLEVAPGHVNEPEPPIERQFSPLCAHWRNWRTGLDLGAAREKLRVTAALADLNHISAARPFTEARLLAVACGATAEQVERLVRGWRGVDREAAAAGEDGAQMCLARRGLSLRVDEDGMVVLRALEQVPAAPADGTPARGGVGRPRGGVGRPRDCLRDYPRRAGACRGNSGYSVVRSDSSSRRRSAWKASWSIPVASLMTDHSIPARKKFSIVPS